MSQKQKVTHPIKRLLVKAKLKQSFKSIKKRLRLLRKAHRTAPKPALLPHSTNSPGTKPYVLHLKKGKHNNTFANSKFIPNLLTLKAVNPKSTTASVHPTIDFCASHAPKGNHITIPQNTNLNLLAKPHFSKYHLSYL